MLIYLLLILEIDTALLNNRCDTYLKPTNQQPCCDLLTGLFLALDIPEFHIVSMSLKSIFEIIIYCSYKQFKHYCKDKLH